jgi:aquaporin NIP
MGNSEEIVLGNVMSDPNDRVTLPARKKRASPHCRKGSRSAIMKRLAAELLGTFALVFAGTGAIIINDVSHGTVSHVGIALTFGFVITAMIYSVGDVSGAHFNPAVTLGFFLAKRLGGRLVLPYVLSQLAGAFLASLVLKLLFPAHETLGATLPAGSALQSFVLEAILTFFLSVAL